LAEISQALNSKELLIIYQHCEFLDYQSLMNRCCGRLLGKSYEALPTVEEITVYQTSIPTLYENAIRYLSTQMVRPWACSYAHYYALAASNAVFKKDLGKAIRELLDTRIKSGEHYYRTTKDPQVRWAIEYNDRVRAGRSPRSLKKFPTKPFKDNAVAEAPGLLSKPPVDASKTEAAQDASKEPVQESAVEAKKSAGCYTCGEEGHLARNCTVKIKDAFKRPPPECYGCGGTGHIHRYCPDKQFNNVNDGEGLPATSNHSRNFQVKEPFFCFNCGGEGHISRNCTVEVPEESVEFVGVTPPVRDYSGRNKHFRRAQRYRETSYIYTYDFGGGLQTCDREVKKGEMTRLGLSI
jgi:hypothetical protein